MSEFTPETVKPMVSEEPELAELLAPEIDHKLLSIEDVKDLPLREQAEWLAKNFGRQALRQAGVIASKGTSLRDIIGDEAVSKLQERQLQRTRRRPRQSFRDALNSCKYIN
jgi:hypothetical protein